MKSENWIIVEALAFLWSVTVLGFFRVPAYDKGVWFIVGVVAGVLTTVIGYKFGRSMPAQAGDQKPGQTSETKTTTETAPPPPP